MPDFSSWKLLSHTAQSGWEGFKATRRDRGHCLLSVLALTKITDGSGWRNDNGWWLGRRIPLVQRSCHVVGRLGMLTPQSSFFLLI